MSAPRWHDGRGPISFEVAVEDGQHRISWVRGHVVLHDHDLEAERVLLALGGVEPCLCLEILEACRTPDADLTYAPVTPSFGQLPPWQPRARRVATYGPGPQKASLLSGPLPPQQLASHQHGTRRLRRRLIAEVIPEALRDILAIAWETRQARQRRRPRPPAEPQTAEARLQAAVAEAARTAMVGARRDLSPYASFTIECEKRSNGECPPPRGALNRSGGTMALALPVAWLNRVWARGLAVVDGHLVLEVDRAAPATDLEGVAVRWERRPAGDSLPVTAPCSLRRAGNGAWALAW